MKQIEITVRLDENMQNAIRKLEKNKSGYWYLLDYELIA